MPITTHSARTDSNCLDYQEPDTNLFHIAAYSIAC